MKLLSVKTEFFRQTILMFIGISLFNFFSLLYNLFMVRYLPPIDFGQLNTLLALFMVVSVPAATVQTAITRFVSPLQVQGEYDRMKGLLRHFLIVMSIGGFLLFFLIFAASSWISVFLQIPSRTLVVLFGASLLFTMMNLVPWGGLQGLQRFGALILNFIINGGLKLMIGIIFIALGFGLFGAMGAIGIAYFVSAVLSVFMLKSYLPKKRGPSTHKGQGILGGNPSHFAEVYYYFFPTGITLLCFMLLTNVDLIVIKHYFPPLDAGYYSIAQMVGKIMLALPLPIVTVMFPKLSALREKTQHKEGFSILGQSLAMACLLCIAAAAFCFLFPLFIIKVLSGKAYLECVPLVRWFCVNMTFYSVGSVLLYYHLSRQRHGFLQPLLFFTAAQTVLLILFHHSLTQVLFIVAVVAFCLLAINLFIAYCPHHNGAVE